MASSVKVVINGEDKSKPAFDSARGNMDKLSGVAGSLTNILGVGLKAAAVASAAAITALAVGLSSSVKSAMNMQQQLADITASMGTTAEETGKLKSLITNLGMDPKLKVSATEAADAIQTLGTAGLSVDQILNGAARSTVLLANATGADFGTAAAIATDAMAQFGIKAEDLQTAVNGITATTINSKFGINDYRLALAQAGGVAATVGVDFDDFNATIALISPNFASGSDAGTSYKTMLQRLIPASDEATGLMKELGLMTADGANQFFDASGNMKSMAEISGLLNRATKDLSEEQKLNAFSTIFGTDAMRAAAVIAGTTEEQFNALKATMAKTDAEKSAATRMDTLQGAMEILSGTIETIQLQIGDKFIPVLTRMAKKFNEFLAGAAPSIVEWAGNLATWIEQLSDQYLPILMTKMAEWWQWVKTMGLTLLDMGRGISNFIGHTIDLIKWLRNTWGETFETLRTISANVIDYLSSKFNGLWVVIEAFGGGALKEIIDFARGNETQFTHLSLIWEQAKVTARALFNDLTNYVRANAPMWAANLKDWGVAAWQWIVDVTPIAVAKLTEWGKALWNWATVNYPSWAAKLAEWGGALWEWAVGAWAWVKPHLETFWGALSSWVTDPNKRKMLWNGVSTVWNVWKDWSNSIHGWIEPGLIGMLNWLRSWIEDPAKRKMLWDGLKNNWEVFTGFALLLVPGMGPGLSLAWSFLHTWVTDPDKRARLWEGVKDWGNAITGFAAWLWDGGNGITGMRPILENWWTSFKGWMGSKFPEAAIELGKLKVKFNEFFTELDSLLRSRGDGTKRTWSEIWAGMDWGKGFAEIMKGIGDLVTMFTGLTKILRGFKDNDWGPVWEGIKDIASGAWSLIKRNLDVNPFFQGIVALFQKYGTIIKDAWNGMWTGMSTAGFSTALNNIINTFNAVMDRFRDHVWGVMTGIGKRIVDGIGAGISNGIGALQDALSWVTSAMPDWVRNALGIHSPSELFAKISEWIPVSMGLGIDRKSNAPLDALSTLASNMLSGFQESLTMPIPAMAMSGATQAVTNSAVNNNNVGNRINNFNIQQSGQSSGNPLDDVRRLSMLYGT